MFFKIFPRSGKGAVMTLFRGKLAEMLLASALAGSFSAIALAETVVPEAEEARF